MSISTVAPGPTNMPNVPTLQMFEGLIDKLSCWSFFSVMRQILSEFIFSLHIIDNLICLPGLYVRNIIKHYQHTTLEALLPDGVCHDLLNKTLCNKKIGYPTVENSILERYKDGGIRPNPCSPPISEKTSELFIDTPWVDLIYYEFPNSEVAFYYTISQMEVCSEDKLSKLSETLARIVKTKTSSSSLKKKECRPTPIKLTFMTDFNNVKDFVYCGDVQLGKITDTKGICSKDLMIKDNQLDIPIVYTPDFVQLSEIDLESDTPLFPYLREVILDMKLLEIISLVQSTKLKSK